MEDIFVEKYRPKSFSDGFIGNDFIVNKLKSLCEQNPKKIPHLLLISRSPGTGKTSLSKIIVNHIGADYILLNASDERGINVIRDKVKRFVSAYSSKPNVPRFIILDEADGLTHESQDSLRNLMETYSSNSRFILCCNYEHKIILPIKSRCLPIRFSEPPRDKILERLKFICENEKMKYDITALNVIINKFYPDIRQMINKINELYLSGKDVITSNLYFEENIYQEIYNQIKNKNFDNARISWLKNGVNLFELLKFLYEKFYEDNELTKQQKQEIILILSEADFRGKIGADYEISLSAAILKIINILEGGKDKLS